MAKIKEMKLDELVNAMRYMSSAPIEDPHFSGWNFDTEDWLLKFKELVDQTKIVINESEKGE